MSDSVASDHLVRRALLSTVDGHRSAIELESVARAMGLDATALHELIQLGLVQSQCDDSRAADH